jgi:hypothetical protein
LSVLDARSSCGRFAPDPELLGEVLHHQPRHGERVLEEQADVADGADLEREAQARVITQHEHTREIRNWLRYSDFADGDIELRAFVASRVWNSVESRRALFHRAVVWLLRNRVLQAPTPELRNTQLNMTESRHNLARRIFSGTSASSGRNTSREWRTSWARSGWDSIVSRGGIRCISMLRKELEASGMSISPEVRARLSPLQFEHINFNGRYPLARPDLTGGGLRPLRDPSAEYG